MMNSQKSRILHGLFSLGDLDLSAARYALKLFCISDNPAKHIHGAVSPRLGTRADRGWTKKNTT
jgi:hypothetical protein